PISATLAGILNILDFALKMMTGTTGGLMDVFNPNSDMWKKGAVGWGDQLKKTGEALFPHNGPSKYFIPPPPPGTVPGGPSPSGMGPVSKNGLVPPPPPTSFSMPPGFDHWSVDKQTKWLISNPPPHIGPPPSAVQNYQNQAATQPANNAKYLEGSKYTRMFVGAVQNMFNHPNNQTTVHVNQ